MNTFTVLCVYDMTLVLLKSNGKMDGSTDCRFFRHADTDYYSQLQTDNQYCWTDIFLV